MRGRKVVRHLLSVAVVATLLSVLVGTASAALLPAFPGAEGWGAAALNNCRQLPLLIHKVTNTNNSGPGSFRAAMSALQPDRYNIVVFTTGGLINLSSEINITGLVKCTYIAGQSAPGGGITFIGHRIEFGNAEDLVVRYIRHRGQFSDGVRTRGTRVIWDHFTGSWSGTPSRDSANAFSFSPRTSTGVGTDYTVQNSLIYEPGDHPTMIVVNSGLNGFIDRVTVHRNAMLGPGHRMPMCSAGGAMSVTNNIIYNWQSRGSETNRAYNCDFIANYNKPGPATSPTAFQGMPFVLSDMPDQGDPTGGCSTDGQNCFQSVYVSGNRNHKNNYDASLGDPWTGPYRQIGCLQAGGWCPSKGGEVPAAVRANIKRNQPLPPAPIPANVQPITDQLVDQILSDVGASRRLACDGSWVWMRESIDDERIAWFYAGTGWSTRPDVTAFTIPVPAAGTPCADSDNDGMPDAWENLHANLNPAVVDNDGDPDGDGYLNIEEYLNGTDPNVADTFGGGDSTPPAAPSGLTASAVSPFRIDLDWADNTEGDLDGYHVYRSTTPGFTPSAGNRIATDVATSAFSDTGLSPSTTYYYKVTAVDTSFNESSPSNQASATTEASNDTTPPDAPTGLVATAVSEFEIDLDWEDNAEGDLSGYNVYRSTTPDFTPAVGNRIAGGVTTSSYADTGLAASTTYYYKVTAVDMSSNESSPSNEANATTHTLTVWNTRIEAEAMTLTSPMTVGSDSGAFEGGYIHVPSSQGSTTTSPVVEAEKSVTVPANDTYYLWARMYGPNDQSDALYFTIDDGTWLRRWPSALGTWEWVLVNSFTLTAGAHDLQIGHGETNARVDALYLTSDVNETPPSPSLDTTPPAAPSGLSATAVSASEIHLDWSDNAEGDLGGYNVYRSTVSGFSPGAGNLIANRVLASAYADTGLAASTTYYYKVTAVDTSSNESSPSNQASATTAAADTTPPAAPTGLSATALSASEIDLDWSDNTESDLSGYNVYRSTTPGFTPSAGNLIASGLTASAYTDTGLAESTTYYYKVTAVDTSSNESPPSGEASATTAAAVDTTPPAAPTGLFATAASASEIELDWADNTEDDLAGYNVYRSTTPGFTPGAGNQIATGVTSSAYTDTGLSASTTYYYKVTAVDDSSNESAPSNEAGATTHASGATETETIQPSDDAYLQDATLYNWGDLRVGSGTTAKLAYLKFTVGDLGGRAIVQAILKMKNIENQSRDDVYEVWSGTHNNWTESTLSSSNKPGKAMLLDSVASVPALAVVSWDVSDFITEEGTYTLIVSCDPTCPTARFGSTESSDPPVLELLLSGGTQPDTTPPAAPTGLSATAVSASGIGLDWSDNTEGDLGGYNVYRSTTSGFTPGPGNLIATGVTASAYSDTGLAASTTYFYKVTAVDESMNESAPSSEASATTEAFADTETYQPTDDAYLQGATLFNSGDLRVGDGTTTKVAYLKFTIDNLDGREVVEATLKLKNIENQNRNDVYEVWSGAHNNWTESTLSSSIKPDKSTLLDSVSSVPALAVVSWDVSDFITGEGTYTLIVSCDSSCPTARFGSTESSDAPVLELKLRSGWFGADVGAVGLAGSHGESAGAISVEGSGAGIEGTADEFYFVYQLLTGDGEIVARVSSMESTGTSAMAGVMIRENLTADSKHAAMLMNEGGGAVFTTRASSGGSTSTASASGTPSVPRWVKVVRSGTAFEGYESSDGVNWNLVGSTTISMGTNVYIGLAVSSNDDSTLNTSTFDNVAVTD